MDRKGFLMTTWKYRLRPVVNVLAIIVIGLLLLAINSVDFAGSVFEILTAIVKIIAILFISYWPWILLIIASMVILKGLENRVPQKHKDAFGHVVNWLSLLGLVVLLIWFSYQFYLKKEYFNMIFYSGWILFSFVRNYSKKKTLKEASE